MSCTKPMNANRTQESLFSCEIQMQHLTTIIGTFLEYDNNVMHSRSFHHARRTVQHPRLQRRKQQRPGERKKREREMEGAQMDECVTNCMHLPIWYSHQYYYYSIIYKQILKCITYSNCVSFHSMKNHKVTIIQNQICIRPIPKVKSLHL